MCSTGGNDVFTYQLTDGDGDTSTATLTITVPQVNTPPDVRGSEVSVSEEGLVGGNKDTTGTPDTTDSRTASSSVFVHDADGDALTVTLGVPAGTFTSGGETITWALSNGGQTLTGSADGNTIITVTIHNDGTYDVALSGPVDHAPDAGEQALGITVPVSVSDGIATVPTTIGISIEDDSPVVNPVVDAEATVTLDETGPAAASTISTGAIVKGDDPDVSGSGAISKATSGAAIVDANVAFGGDGPAASDSLTYALSITGASSGLTTTDGSAINLVMENGVIVGVVSGGAFNGEAAFAIAINPATGVVTVEQYLSLDHPITTDPNDALHMLTGSVGVTVTATDADQDSVTSGAVDVSNQITFLDDGPSVSPTLNADATVTLDETGPAVASTISTGVDRQGRRSGRGGLGRDQQGDFGLGDRRWPCGVRRRRSRDHGLTELRSRHHQCDLGPDDDRRPRDHFGDAERGHRRRRPGRHVRRRCGVRNLGQPDHRRGDGRAISVARSSDHDRSRTMRCTC